MPSAKTIEIRDPEKEDEVNLSVKTKPFSTEGELGICDSCKCYCFLKQHERREGVLFIKCLASDVLVPVRTDINEPEECELFPKDGFFR